MISRPWRRTHEGWVDDLLRGSAAAISSVDAATHPSRCATQQEGSKLARTKVQIEHQCGDAPGKRNRHDFQGSKADAFPACAYDGRVAVIALDRPERKNPLTFESYAELRDWFRELVYADDVKAVVFASNGGNFSSGGDVHDIIGRCSTA